MKNAKLFTEVIIIIIFITFYSPKVFAIPPAPPVEKPYEPPEPPPPEILKEPDSPPPPEGPPPTPTPTPCIPAPCYYMVTECCFNMGCLFLGNSINTSCKLGNVDRSQKLQSAPQNKNIKTQSKNTPFFIKMIEFLKVIF